MSDEEFKKALAQIGEAVKRLDAVKREVSLPEYTRYGGLRVLEANGRAESEPEQLPGKSAAA
jgi:hypothetical protein